MNLRTKRILCAIVAIVSVMTIVGAVSYAYFTAIGEVRKQEATISTGTVTLTFADNDAGLSAELAFGESATKKFTMVNTGTADSRVKMSFIEMVNTYTEGSLTYTLSYSENVDGPYTEVVSETNVPQSKTSSKKLLANSLTIPAGKTYYYNLVVTLNYLDDVNQDTDITAIFNTKFIVEDINTKEPPITEKIIASSNGAKSDFSQIAETDEGIFEMEDDYGTSYYYRGSVENNYVKFAGFYWRIIRINGDGSLRILYDGTRGYANGVEDEGRVALTGVAWNPNYDDAKYVGYMYGGANGEASTSKVQAQTNETDTNIKTKLDEWYKTNIADKGYEGAVADAIFCNDRSTPTSNNLGYGTSYTEYGTLSRHVNLSSWETNDNPTLTLKCSQKNDAFTVNDTRVGNGALTYPVGLITIDEAALAGGKYYKSDGTSNNNKYYLYKGSLYWSLSPSSFGDTSAYIFYVDASGQLYGDSGGRDGAVVPVINLRAEYASTLIGEGTMTSPYRQSGEAI